MDASRILRWWLLFLAYGVIALPACTVLFRKNPDKGYGFSRIIGYLAASYMMFLFSVLHVFKFTFAATVVSALVLVVAQVVWLVIRKDHAKIFTDALKDRSFWIHAAIEELVFLVALAVWAGLRAKYPDLNSLEKYMNLGYINSMLNTEYMPAQDMWAAGLNINYYYFGHFCAACATRLSGLASDVAYNLMMSTLFAGTLCGVFTLVYGMLDSRKKGRRIFSVIGGSLSAVMVCLAGNLHYFVYGILNDIFFPGHEYTYWFPDATRYIGYQPVVENDQTITEFPLYSFIVSDLHAHVMDLLPVIVLLGVAFVFLRKCYAQKDDEIPGWGKIFVPAPEVIIIGVIIGLFSMTNFWDYPIYMVVMLFIFAYAGWCKFRFRPQMFVWVLWQMGLLFAVHYVISLPFTIGFEAMFSGIGWVTTRSKLYQLLVLHGGPLAIGIFFAVWLFAKEKGRDNLLPVKGKKSLGKALPEKQTFSLAVFQPQDILALIFVICSFGLAFGTEFVYVRDIYEESYPRANTMFKLSYQAFLLGNIAIGYIFARVIDCSRKVWKSVVIGACIGGLCLALLSYNTNAIPAWYGNDYQGLDGLNFINNFSTYTDEAGQVHYPDRDAVDWISKNTAKDDVVLEVFGESYSERCFVSVCTGRATVEGWCTHEWLWRNGYDFVAEREGHVRELYTSKDKARVAELLAQYGVDYIYLGHFEQEEFGNDLNFGAYRELTEPVFSEGNVQILKVKG